MKNNIMRS